MSWWAPERVAGACTYSKRRVNRIPSYRGEIFWSSRAPEILDTERDAPSFSAEAASGSDG